ncbi:conserved hypothetical protein [Candidatus Magnetomoraceae bacterium gMMP-15]
MAEQTTAEPYSDIVQTIQTCIRQELRKGRRKYFVLFILLTMVTGLFLSMESSSRQFFLESVGRSIYPPKSIYRDIKSEFLNDQDLLENLFYKQKPKTDTPTDKNITGEIWATLETGTRENYSRIVDKSGFYEALLDYHKELIKSFIVPKSDRRARIRDILEIGKIPLNTQVLMVAKRLDGRQTAKCFKTFRQNKLHAILVIPKTASPEEYSWFNCDFRWPNMHLKLSVKGKSVSDIKLVGVRRNGKTKKLIILVSKKIAQELNLAGWKKYRANDFGVLTVDSAD